MHRVSRSVVAVCAVASLLVTGAGVSPVSAKTINGCVIKAKTKCVKADLKADLKGAILKGANLKRANLKGAYLDNAKLAGAKLNGILSGGITGTPQSLPAGWILRSGYLIGPVANLNGADLTNAVLTGVTWSNTTCPDGSITTTSC